MCIVSVTELPKMSTSVVSTSSCRERVGGVSPENGDEQFVEQVAESDMSYSIFLESESSEEESSSDSDDDILDFLETMKLVKPKTLGEQRSDAKDISNSKFQQYVARPVVKVSKNGRNTRRIISNIERCKRRGPYSRGTLTAPPKQSLASCQPQASISDSEDLDVHTNMKDSATQTSRNKKRYKCKNIESVDARIRRNGQQKMYIDKLEEKVANLESENENLTSRVIEKSNEIDLMKNEINYLKGVITNHTSLSSLLNHIPFSKGMQLASSLAPFVKSQNTQARPESTKTANSNSKKREREELLDLNAGELSITAEGDDVFVVKRLLKKPAPEPPVPGCAKLTMPVRRPTTPGVCLHVSNDKVSLEVCPICATNASTATTLSGIAEKRLQ